MNQEFQSSKYFSVGDMFLKENKPFCFIAKITQARKGAQYYHYLEYFTNIGERRKWFILSTLRLRDRIIYSRWIHLPVVK